MKRLVMACVVVGLVFGLTSVSYGVWEVQVWNNLTGDGLWVTPGNWELWDLDIPGPVAVTGAAPTPDEEVTIDPPTEWGYPAAAGPLIRAGDAATCYGIQTIQPSDVPGGTDLTMDGGTLDITRWVWWGDGLNSFPTWYQNGGKVTGSREYELGWGGAGGLLVHTGGNFLFEELVVPTSSGVSGNYIGLGGHFRAFKEDGMSMAPVGFIDLSGTLIHIADTDGSMVPIIQSWVDAGQIVGFGGAGVVKIKHFPASKGSWAHTNVWGYIPEPSTISLLASLLVLGGVASLFRRR
jgi:hypothetical protein